MEQSSQLEKLDKLAQLVGDVANRLAQDFGAEHAAAKRAREVANRLTDQQFMIIVMGAYSTGKSAMINALLDIDLLPVDPRETTGSLTIIRLPDKAGETTGSPADKPSGDYYGLRTEGAADVRFNSLPLLKAELEKRTSLVRLRDPSARSDLVEVFVQNERLQRWRAAVVDSPGLDKDERLGELGHRFYPRADLILLVTQAQGGLRATEIEFLRQLKSTLDDNLQRAAIIFNMADTLDMTEPGVVNDLFQYHKGVLSKEFGEITASGMEPRMFMISARYRDRQPGIDGLPENIEALAQHWRRLNEFLDRRLAVKSAQSLLDLGSFHLRSLAAAAERDRQIKLDAAAQLRQLDAADAAQRRKQAQQQLEQAQSEMDECLSKLREDFSREVLVRFEADYDDLVERLSACGERVVDGAEKKSLSEVLQRELEREFTDWQVRTHENIQSGINSLKASVKNDIEKWNVRLGENWAKTVVAGTDPSTFAAAGVGSMTAAGLAMAAATMGPLGGYALATSALAAVGSALGITFSFGTYTALTTAIAALGGPVVVGAVLAVGAALTALGITKAAWKQRAKNDVVSEIRSRIAPDIKSSYLTSFYELETELTLAAAETMQDVIDYHRAQLNQIWKARSAHQAAWVVEEQSLRDGIAFYSSIPRRIQDIMGEVEHG